MEIRPIHTEDDYQCALREVSAYFENEPEPGSPDGDRFEIVLALVETYEAKHFPIDLPDPVEAIKFRMEQSGLTGKDLLEGFVWSIDTGRLMGNPGYCPQICACR